MKNYRQKNINEGLNVLLVGDGENLSYVHNSKYLNKLYATSENCKYNDVVIIDFITFKELAQKCKALQIDLVIVENSRYINEGIADVLKSYFINCIAPTAKWAELAHSTLYARELLKKYKISTPPIIILPSEFPLIVKGDGVLRKANSIEEVIEIKNEVLKYSSERAKNLYLEKYLDGKNLLITSLFDGKNFLTFPSEEIEKNILEDYSNKLKELFIKEKAAFIGFVHSKVIIYENKLYNIGFRFEFRKSACDLDILYVLWLAIYQKLNEVSL